MVAKLRGMFAFALWDNAKRGLFLARDPYGITALWDDWALQVLVCPHVDGVAWRSGFRPY